jgi:hypothetical protein
MLAWLKMNTGLIRIAIGLCYSTEGFKQAQKCQLFFKSSTIFALLGTHKQTFQRVRALIAAY